jgi:hypothetical protein
MRRLRNDLPYTFRPPHDNSCLRPLGLHVNRQIHLARKYRITRISEEGFVRAGDLLGFPAYPVDRTARVSAGAPVPVSDLLASGEIPMKGGAIPLTELLEKQLASLLA